MFFRDKNQNYVYMALIIAIVLGVYAQDITYYISENVINIPRGLCIAIITIISLSLFIIPSVIIIKNKKNSGNIDKIMKIYLMINAIVGVPVSAFSIFVMLMWMG